MNIGAHLSLGIFPFAFRCVLSAQLAFQIYFGGAPIESFKLLFLGLPTRFDFEVAAGIATGTHIWSAPRCKGNLASATCGK